MSTASWSDIDEDVENAVRHFSMAITIAAESEFDDAGTKGYIASMALMHSMQSAHTSVEVALKRLMRVLDEPLPDDPDWHERLISRLARPITGSSARPALLSRELAEDLQETRSFRHRAMHNYDHFRVERAKPALDAAGRIVASLPEAFRQFRAIVDPPSAHGDPK